MAWALITGDKRFMDQRLTKGQADDAQEKARTNREGARRAVRAAWSHVLHALKTPDTEPGTAFDLEHIGVSAKDRNAIPAMVYDKARADYVIKERLGPDSLRLKLKDLCQKMLPTSQSTRSRNGFGACLHAEASRPGLETSIREAIGKFDAPFGYAERFDQTSGDYAGLIYAKAAPEVLSPTGLLVRAKPAKEQLSRVSTVSRVLIPAGGGPMGPAAPSPDGTGHSPTPPPSTNPRRFYGSVEIDMSHRVKAFDTILAMCSQLQMELDNEAFTIEFAVVSRPEATNVARCDHIGLPRAETADFISVPSHVFAQMVSDGRMPRPKDLDGHKV